MYTWRPADEELRAELLELLPPGKSEDGVFTNAHSCRILELMSTPMLAAAFVEGFMRAGAYSFRIVPWNSWQTVSKPFAKRFGKPFAKPSANGSANGLPNGLETVRQTVWRLF
eukprot:SAG31_NODE_1167_length_9572_cov_3.794046_4_plen_113_part_00